MENMEHVESVGESRYLNIPPESLDRSASPAFTLKRELETKEWRERLIQKIDYFLNDFSGEISDAPDRSAAKENEQKDHKTSVEWFAAVFSFFDGTIQRYLPIELKNEVRKLFDDFYKRRSSREEGRNAVAIKEEIDRMDKLLEHSKVIVEEFFKEPAEKLTIDPSRTSFNEAITHISPEQVEVFNFPEYNGLRLRNVADSIRDTVIPANSGEYYFPDKVDLKYLCTHADIVPENLKDG